MSIRPLLGRSLVWSLPLLLLVAAWQLWDYVEARRFAEVAARIASRARPSDPVVRNNAGWDADEAGRYYAAAAIAYYRPELTPPLSIEAVAEEYRRAISTGTQIDQKTLELARSWLRDNQATLRLIDEAAALPFGGFSAGTDFSYRTTTLASIHDIASLNTLDLVILGDVERATASLISRAKAIRVFTAQPGSLYWSIQPLVQAITDAAVVLWHPAAPVESAVLFEEALQEIDPETLHLRFLLGQERAMYDLYSATFRLGPSSRSATQLALANLGRPIARRQAVAFVNAFDEAVEATALPWPQRLEALQRIEAPGMIRVVGLPANPSRATPYGGAAKRGASLVALSRSLRVALAIERHRRETGGLPARLDDLHALNPDARLDPFTNQSLRLATAANGLTVYSLGENVRDDGGSIEGIRRQPGESAGPPLDVGIHVAILR